MCFPTKTQTQSLPDFYESSISDISTFIQRSSSPLVVVFMRGHKNTAIIKNNPGNIYYRNVIEEHVVKYNQIDVGMRKVKTAFTTNLTKKLVDDGFRFVTWDARMHKFYEYDVNNEMGLKKVREKVRQALTDGWKKFFNDTLNDDLLDIANQRIDVNLETGAALTKVFAL